MSNHAPTRKLDIDNELVFVVRSNVGTNAKLFARKVGRSHRTVENWMAGRNGMRAADLIAAMAANDRLAADVLALVRARRPATP